VKKKLVGSLLLSIIFAYGTGGGAAFAASSSAPVTIVTGYVYDSDWVTPEAGANVQINCMDIYTGQFMGFTEDVTDSTGAFLATFPQSDCPADAFIYADATNAAQTNVGRSRTEAGPINSKLSFAGIDVAMFSE
jgi:hypothetical protein